MKNNIETLRVFNTLEAFKRKEYKLVKESAGLVVLSLGVVGVSTAVLPDAVATIPTLIVGVPAMAVAFQKALIADKISNHAQGIFENNKEDIMNFKLGSMQEVTDFTNNYPTLSMHYPNLLK